MTVLLSETFTGTNGADWSPTNWDYKYFQFGGIGDIQSNKGRLVTGAIGSAQDYGAYRSSASFTNFRATFDYTVSGTTTTGSYLAFGFRASSAWVSGEMIADACYYVELKRGSPNATFSVNKRLSGATSTLSTASATFTAGDVVHVKVIANGSSIKVRYWKNAAAEPATWNVDVVDTAHTAGKFFFSTNGGSDTTVETFTVDDFLVDDVLTEGSSSPAAGSINAAGAAYSPTISAVDGATPTLFAETWTGSNGAGWPAQWTTTASGTGAVADIQSNKGRMATGTGLYGKVGARNTSALSSDDYTLQVDIVIPTYAEWYFFVHVRGANTFSNTFTIISSYQFRFTSYLGAIVPEFYEVDAAGVMTLIAAGAITGTPIAGDTLRIKIEVAGSTTLKEKAWIVGASEPGYTDLSASVVTAYSGNYVALSVQGGNDVVSEDFLWDNFTVVSPDDGTADAQTASAAGAANTANPSIKGFAAAQLASGHGAGWFDAAGGTMTIILEALDAVEVLGQAFGAQKAHYAGTGTGAGTAYNATVNVGGITGASFAVDASSVLTYATDPAASTSPLTYNFITGQVGLLTPGVGSGSLGPVNAAGTATANNATVTRKGNPRPTAATGAGSVSNAAPSGVVGQVDAECATGNGESNGIAYIYDENHDPILDHNGDFILDAAGPTLTVKPAISASTSSGASNSATSKVSPHAGVGSGVGAAPSPGISTSAGTNVNATTGTSSGAADDATATVSPAATTGASTGAANAPQVTLSVQAGDATSVGVAHDTPRRAVAEHAASIGAAHDAQVDVLANNFIAAAPIPISVSAADASISISVYPDGLTSVGRASAANQSADIPGQLVTVRDRGHTVSMKEC